jgi:hypothetical protein
MVRELGGCDPTKTANLAFCITSGWSTSTMKYTCVPRVWLEDVIEFRRVYRVAMLV